MKLFCFRIACPLGLESLAAEEIQEKAKLLAIALPALQRGAGEIRVELSLESIRKLQAYLKISNRITVILHQSRVRDLPKLFKKLQQIEWRHWLLGRDYKLKVYCKRSRLMLKERIASCAADAIEKYYVAQSPKKYAQSFTQQIVLRFLDDELEVAIDLSGEHLHRRQGPRQVGKAPLRETYAAALFYFLKSQSPIAIDKLFDPMCGSGSLLIEAHDFYRPSRRPFAIDFLPSFLFQKPPADGELLGDLPHRFTASDLSPIAIEKCRSNWGERRAPLLAEVADACQPKSWQHFDFTGLLCNLPYDERIRFRQQDFHAFCDQLQDYPHIPTALLIATQNEALFQKRFAPRIGARLGFKNSGLPVTMLYLQPLLTNR